ncbi:23S rRNA (pseudouridine(1915)-N(3))-methyltransferase RlmH [Pusillimonas noertemannii]|uniref:Ribosomal RNA large subunit methyltransferase H n=1 Tax=Pusillimonas noertemannii TaxID=305977 RepID=A0A2U1CKI9_9BURK|nr:23S rRNA (pseudouridine(1915)-N(3))-methyltransferase RlmH [Pusillimonas noertemannii]NYT69564.1 23S rRNA (pseudouridine(1915)-N(3))-methyltransferase RlmH [Pusillimonas noertemannii]PVY61512.1 23S rRNA (pseudouridine1915-N3)-methyltransferase [Pusillimonas noertemannii]TFL08897.1 23S rRNA (pseudouridine(1915)-N(3))-methyltransferase RlmH [Pusillimonas noertemannii]
MKLFVIAVGHRMPGWVEQAWQDYARRLPPDCALELREIKPEPRSGGKTPAQMMQAEARRIEAAIPANALRIALDERGRDLTTRKLSSELEHWRGMGRDVALLVGGPDGLDAQLKDSCDSLLRLSSLTLPHPMVRVVLAEQIYRAWAIMVNHPYHRA